MKCWLHHRRNGTHRAPQTADRRVVVIICGECARQAAAVGVPAHLIRKPA